MYCDGLGRVSIFYHGWGLRRRHGSACCDASVLEGVIESIDEFYSENLGQDIRRGMRENASRGFFNGSRPPYGLRKVKVRDGDRDRNKLEPEPEDSIAVKTVKRIFNMAFRDIGCKEIAKTLNREGFRTGSGQRWII